MSKKKKKTDLVNFDFSSANENIIDRNIATQSEEWQKIFGANKNLYRHIPSMIDGLKPVDRRVLYMMYMRKHYNNDYIKVSSAMGATLEIHPHGDQSLGDVFVGMARPWDNNAPVIDIPANIGSQSGTREASPRYLDATISKFGYECYFENFKNSAVDMKLSYTGKMEEPEYLPAKYPVALINGGFSGIGYGLASNLPMFNLKDICETTIALMDNPDAKVCIAPDIPSGVDIIMSKQQIKDLFELGDSKLSMQAVPEIDYVHNIITFKAIPLQVTTEMISQALAKFKAEGKLDEITNIDDHTSEINGVYLEVELRQDADPEKVLEKMYKMKTYLRKGYSAQLNLIDDYKNKLYSVRSFLLAWIEYRRDTVRAEFNAELISLEEENHINDIKLFIFGGKNGEKTISIAKSSENTRVYTERLMQEYGITSLQAKTIAELSTSAWTKEAYARFLDKQNVLRERISELRDILDSDDRIDNIIKEQQRDGIKKYGRERQSRILSPGEKIIENMEVIVGISEDGYIKKVLKSDGIIGVIGKRTGALNMVIPASNTDSLFVFDEEGVVHIIQVDSIPMVKPKTGGVLTERYNLKKGVKIVSVTTIPKISDIAGKNHMFILSTKRGYMKKVSFASIVKEKASMASPKPIISLTDKDSLSTVVTLVEDKNDELARDVIVYTNLGDGIRLHVLDIPTQQMYSRGVQCLVPRSTEHVVGLDIIKPTDKYLVYVTASGKVKKTELKLFPPMKRRGDLLPLVSLDDNESLVSVISVTGTETLRFHKKNSDAETLDVLAIPATTRIAKATKMIKTPKGDSVVSVIRM